MYAKNLLALVSYITKDGKLELDTRNEILNGALITYNGEVINQRIKDLIK
jgi:NAD(P) transhydrogenase subunit alpha